MTAPLYLPVTAQMNQFIRSNGLPVVFDVVDADAFLPGIAIANGGLRIDRERLLYPEHPLTRRCCADCASSLLLSMEQTTRPRLS